MRPVTDTDALADPESQVPARPVTESQRPPVVIRPFAAPVVSELPQQHAATDTAW